MQNFSREYIEDMTKNNTCHRPDILCYDVCDDCPFVNHCLCSLRRTSKCSPERVRARRKKRK